MFVTSARTFMTAVVQHANSQLKMIIMLERITLRKRDVLSIERVLIALDSTRDKATNDACAHMDVLAPLSVSLSRSDDEHIHSVCMNSGLSSWA